LLEEIVIRNQGEEGVEALEVLFRFNESIGWDYINSKVDCSNESVRVELVDIVKRTDDDVFYSFMTKIIDDPSPAVRKKVIKALNNRMNERSLCLLKKLYQVECDSVNKMEIVSNLYKFNSDNAFYIINDAAFSSDILTRMAAVKALSFINGSKADDMLCRMLDDKVIEVIDAAKAALCKKEMAK
jgi:HEAT repeat protein